MVPLEHLDAYAALARGSIDAALDELPALASARGAPERAWALALRAAGAVIAPEVFSAPELEEVAGHRDDPLPVREVAALAVAHVARPAALGFDIEQLERCLAIGDALTHGSDDASEPRLWLSLGRSWASWLRADSGDHEPALALIEGLARSTRSAALVIDAGVLRALHAQSRGDDAGMMSNARRASRMARTEALPAQEYFAHLVLARARRAARHPHLAIRILGSLETLVAESCRPWVRWERLLSGDLDAVEGMAPGPGAAPAERGAAALAAVLRGAAAGDQAALDRAAGALLEALRGVGPARQEADEVLASLDPRVGPGADAAAIYAWCTGRSADAPPSVHGLCARIDPHMPHQNEAIVLAGPDEPPRRVLGLAAPLAVGPARRRLRSTSRRRGRVETLIAILACAGSRGLSDAECHALAYDAPYDEADRGTYEVLITRGRAYLGDAGEIVHGGGRIALHLRQPIAVSDPRCAAPIYDRLLRLLAREGHINAGDAASRLGLSVRAVQLALRELAEDGVCTGEKDGRQIQYSLEDTTFSEPTSRLMADRRG